MFLFHGKATEKSFLRQKANIMGFSMVCLMLQVRETVLDNCLWLVLTQNSSHTLQKMNSMDFIQFATEANVCKIEFYFKHSVDA